MPKVDLDEVEFVTETTLTIRESKLDGYFFMMELFKSQRSKSER
ncbi:MAG: hypothetical protein ACTSSL_13450 [Candidatus Heimdallarchaeaceae archaeon]